MMMEVDKVMKMLWLALVFKEHWVLNVPLRLLERLHLYYQRFQGSWGVIWWPFKWVSINIVPSECY